MTLHSWIKKIFGAMGRPSAAKVRPIRRENVRRRLRLVPRIEVLEDRLAPASFTVTDNSDNPNDTHSLRYAINHLDVGESKDTNLINFNIPNTSSWTIVLTHGELKVNEGVTITGPGGYSQVTIDGNGASRVFNIEPAFVQLSNLTIEYGIASDRNGGGILNHGNTTLIQSTVTGCSAYGNNGQYPNSFANEGAGGGIFNYAGATLNIVQSTISDNKSQGGAGESLTTGGGAGGGAAALGGGIFNDGALSLVNSTVSGNNALGGAGGNGARSISLRNDYGGGGGGYGGQGGRSNYIGVYYNGADGGFGGGGGGGFGSRYPGCNTRGGNGGFGGGGGGGGAYTLTGLLGSNVVLGGDGGTYGGQGTAGGSSGYPLHAGSGYSGAGGGGAGAGGGIFSRGSLTITASTIADNTANGGAGGSNGFVSAEPGLGVAGGVFAYSGSASLDSTIIADNSTGGPGGGLDADAAGSFSGSYNLIRNTAGVSGLSSATNHLGFDPKLSPLTSSTSNGGTTATMAIAPGPAIEAGDPNDGVTVDQRGVLRNSPPDIGAYQYLAGSSITVTAGGPVTLGSGAALSATAELVTGSPTHPDSSGLLTFTLIDPFGNIVDTETQTVEGRGFYSTPLGYVPTAAGVYFWAASYSGDDLDAGTTSPIDGVEAVRAASPTLTATPSATAVTLSAGATLKDTAVLSGGYNETGQILFTLELAGSIIYSQAVTVSGNGSYTTPTGYSLPASGAVIGTYQWNVSYIADENNNAVSDNNDGNNQVVVSAANPTLTTTPSTTAVTLGASSVNLKDTAVLSGGYNVTGTVTFTLYLNGTPVHMELASVGSDGTCTTANGITLPSTLTVTGAYQWDATYGGDDNNNAVSDDNAVNEQVQVSAANPVLTVTPSATAVTLGTSGGTLKDRAVLSGGYHETGSVTFTLYQAGTLVFTETVAVSGNGSYTTPTGYLLPTSGTAAGAYQWNVSYAGDGNNNAVSDNSDSADQVTVSPASPFFAVMANIPTLTLGSFGSNPLASANLVDGYHETGTITFTLHLGSTVVDTETVAVNGNGTYTTPAGYTLPTLGTVAGTYQWDAVYSGDGNNSAVSDINDAKGQLVLNPASPTLGTTAGGTVVLGSGVNLTASATLASGFLPTGAITFTLTAPNGTTADTETAAVNGNGTYTTPTGYLPTTAGTYQWTAAYNGDGNNKSAKTATAAPETVTPGTPTLTINPVTITYGTALADVQLSGTATLNGQTVAGLFTYTSAAGATLNAGSGQIEGVTFTPSDTTVSTTATGQVTINVAQATPTVSWSTPADIVYGTALSATQLDATASVPGSFTFTPKAGTVLNAGTGQTLSAIFTPTDSIDYKSVNASTSLNVAPAPLTISAVSDSKTYDGTTNSSQTPVVSGLVGSDSVTGLSQAFASKNVFGTKGSTLVVTGYTVNDGDGGGDYTVTTQTAKGTITPRSLTVTATGVNKIYDGTTTATVTLTDNRLFNDNFTDSYSSAMFSTANVGNGLTVSVTGIAISGPDAGNYTLSNATATTTANILPYGSSVVSTRIDDGTAQRSMVRSITLTFSSSIAQTLSTVMVNLSLIRSSDGLCVGLNGTLDSSGKVLTLTFTGSSIMGGSLADGRYTLCYYGSTVLSSTQLWRLFGDLYGTASVTAQDQAAFNAAMNSRKGMSNYSAYLDFDENGWITNNDQTEFKKRLGTSV